MVSNDTLPQDTLTASAPVIEQNKDELVPMSNHERKIRAGLDFVHVDAPQIDEKHVDMVQELRRFSDDQTLVESFMEPKEGVTTWPALPEQYGRDAGDTHQYFFRKPDIFLKPSGRGSFYSEEKESKTDFPYEKLLKQKMKDLGLYRSRGAGTKVARGVAAAGLCLTGVGAFYVKGRTKNIAPGRVGFYQTQTQQPRFLSAGLSLEHNPFHTKFQEYSLNQDHINYQNHVHIVKVQPGHYALALFNGNPRVLLPGDDQTVGVHVIQDPMFDLRRHVLSTEATFNIAQLTFVNVQDGHLRPVKLDNQYYFLFKGQHVIECANLHLYNEQPMNECVQQGNICHYVVHAEQLGGIELCGHPNFIDRPSSFWIRTSYAKYLLPLVPLKEEKVVFGPLTRIVVDDYRKAVVRRGNGDLEWLASGVHLIRQPEVHLVTTSQEWHHCRQNMRAITADPLDVKLLMTMTYHVTDPIAFYKAGDPDKSHETIKEMARSTMCEIIRHMRFEETLKRFGDTYDEDDLKHEPENPYGEQPEEVPAEVIEKQWDAISKKFTNLFTRLLTRDFGVEMDENSWGFQDFDLVDQKLQHQLSQAVLARSEARAERVRLQLTKETASVKMENAQIEARREKYEKTLQAETKKDVALLETQSNKEVALLKMESKQAVENARVDAEHKRKIKQREIDLEDSKAAADAEYYAVQRKADAQAYATKVKAEAEEILVQKNPVHFELERARIQAKMFLDMKPQVFLGNPGQASLMQAMSKFVGTMTHSMGRPDASADEQKYQ